MPGTSTATEPRDIEGRDGRTVRLRPLTHDDRDAILALAQAQSPDDLLFLRTDITDPDVVDEWMASLDNGRTYSVAAQIDGQIAGYASVHMNRAQWTREVGEIRVLVGRPWRRLNIGRLLIEEAVRLAPGHGLRKLTAQMTPDQEGARRIFRELGFRAEALLADYVTDRSGKPRDLLVMTYDLTGFNDQA